jgi:nucleolar protein 14
MAGSQLKRLKASLREQGIIGPQQSKKQKRKNALDQKAKDDKRLRRSEALASIREQFNPFQFKTNARGPKFDVTTNRPTSDKAAMAIKGRPGLAKAVGEERVCPRLPGERAGASAERNVANDSFLAATNTSR